MRRIYLKYCYGACNEKQKGPWKTVGMVMPPFFSRCCAKGGKIDLPDLSWFHLQSLHKTAKAFWVAMMTYLPLDYRCNICMACYQLGTGTTLAVTVPEVNCSIGSTARCPSVGIFDSFFELQVAYCTDRYLVLAPVVCQLWLQYRYRYSAKITVTFKSQRILFYWWIIITIDPSISITSRWRSENEKGYQPLKEIEEERRKGDFVVLYVNV